MIKIDKGDQDFDDKKPGKYVVGSEKWVKPEQIKEQEQSRSVLAPTTATSSSSLPDDQNVEAIESSLYEEKTDVIYGEENVINWALQRLSTVTKTLDLCGDRYGPLIIVANEPIMQKYIELHERGVRQRTITEITRENVIACKKLMEFQEVRHLDGLKGYLSIADGRTLSSHAFGLEGKVLPHAVTTTVRIFVEQQQYFFETLWNKAIPAEQRIREIEEGVEPEVIETIREPKVTQERLFELIKSAKEEILIIFSTSNAFRRQEKAGAVELLIRTAKSKNVKVRILSPFDEYVTNIIKKIKRENKIKIELRNVKEPLQTQVSVLIIDKASLLSAELKSDSKETTLEAIGLATYSNSRATVLSYASIFESLWNQTRLYEETRQLYLQLKSHDRMQKEFMDIAAHELRTPIQPILGLAQILKDQTSDPTHARFVDAILRNAERLQQLQGDLLDVTRIESRSMKIHKEVFNLNELILHVLQDFNTRVKDDNMVKLNYRSDGDIWVTADKNRIIQVMSNLLANAIKFTKSGKVLVHLRNRKSKKIADNNQVIVSVKDEGPGIDPSIIPRLFTKFASKSDKGTGLGLYISKSIVKAHGGRIWAENNKDGRGAIFTFTLPIQKPQKEVPGS